MLQHILAIAPKDFYSKGELMEQEQKKKKKALEEQIKDISELVRKQTNRIENTVLCLKANRGALGKLP